MKPSLVKGRRNGIWLALAAVTCLGAVRGAATSMAAEAGSPAGRRPNLLFIMTDQHRWDCVGANGNTRIKTPNLDRLAVEGANFTHAFVQAPVCVPSRVSFFTGRYSHTHRNRLNDTPLSRGEVLMQARLKAAGDRCPGRWESRANFRWERRLPYSPSFRGRAGLSSHQASQGPRTSTPNVAAGTCQYIPVRPTSVCIPTR